MDIACVQETQLVPHSRFTIKGYSIERLDTPPHKWGVAVMLRDGLNYVRVAVPDGIQAVHLQVYQRDGSPLNIINIYVPPSIAMP